MSLWLSNKVVRSLTELLAESSGGMASAVGIVGLPRVYKALQDTNIHVVALETGPPAGEALSVVVVGGVGNESEWESKLSYWQEILAVGGRLISLDKASAQEVSRRFLCGGLTDLRQETAGRRLITCGTFNSSVRL